MLDRIAKAIRKALVKTERKAAQRAARQPRDPDEGAAGAGVGARLPVIPPSMSGVRALDPPPMKRASGDDERSIPK